MLLFNMETLIKSDSKDIYNITKQLQKIYTTVSMKF